MAAVLNKSYKLKNFSRLYRCNFNATKKFSAESKKDSTINSATLKQTSQQSSFLDELREKIGNGATLSVIFKENPKIKCTSLNQWINYVKLMDLYNFKTEESLLMVRAYPDLLKMPEEKLRRKLELWYNLIIKNDFAKLVMLYNPQFLTLEEEHVKERLGLIHSLAQGNKRSIVLSLLLCPNIMFESTEDITNKFNYLLADWRFEAKEVLRCSALSKKKDFLQLRLTLLEKCGIFKMPYLYTWKKKKAEMKNNNPRLYKICDWNDKDFAEKIAKISLEEYQVYSDIFQETLELYSDDEEVDYNVTDL